ncbi:hypothetical protein GCM10007170_26110 [Arthrobacter liuii]|uniref:Uncharacterized protein n=1 Tax=Arthrobacter liuii TaxID=1476996 RepID=A0ABQ2AVT6_9MICC|nr:hypothetical protein GCM10007170_26110 [Arthrobacter liuii]
MEQAAERGEVLVQPPLKLRVRAQAGPAFPGYRGQHLAARLLVLIDGFLHVDRPFRTSAGLRDRALLYGSIPRHTPKAFDGGTVLPPFGPGRPHTVMPTPT